MTVKTRPIWRSGPPPSIGWWPASYSCDPTILRWWDGEAWSYFCQRGDSTEYIAKRAASHSELHESIRWTDRPARWPKRSKT